MCTHRHVLVVQSCHPPPPPQLVSPGKHLSLGPPIPEFDCPLLPRYIVQTIWLRYTWLHNTMCHVRIYAWLHSVLCFYEHVLGSSSIVLLSSMTPLPEEMLVMVDTVWESFRHPCSESFNSIHEVLAQNTTMCFCCKCALVRKIDRHFYGPDWSGRSVSQPGGDQSHINGKSTICYYFFG